MVQCVEVYACKIIHLSFLQLFSFTFTFVVVDFLLFSPIVRPIFCVFLDRMGLANEL